MSGPERVRRHRRRRGISTLKRAALAAILASAPQLIVMIIAVADKLLKSR